MEHPRAGIYRIGEIEIDVSLGCLRRSGEEVRLRPRTMQVLLHLIEQRHRLVPREELFTRFWPDTAVTDDALAQCLVDIRRALGDSFRDPRLVRTVPKVGYRFIADVEEIPVVEHTDVRRSGGEPTHTNMVVLEEETTREVELVEETSELDVRHVPAAFQLPAPRARFPRALWIAVGVAVVMIGGLAAAGWRLAAPRRSSPVDVVLPTVPGKTPVAIMYLDNQSNSRELSWLREGLADMLIANLSRAGQLAVLSRHELQLVLERIGHAPGRPIDLSTAIGVARSSRAATVALGSFASFGTTVRVSVQLHDTGTGRLQATESVTADAPEQIPARMDALSVKLAAHLGGVIAPAADRASALPVMTDDLEAYRHYSLAVERANAFDTVNAIRLLDKAIAIDPEFAMAHARVGFAYAVTGFEPDRGRPYLERAFRLSSRLTEKDTWLITAWHAIASLDYARAIESLRKVVANYPAETDAYLRLGLLLRGEDRPREAIEIVERGLSFAPDVDEGLRELGILYLEAGDQDRAIASLTKAVSVAPSEAVSHERLGTAFRWMGRYDEADASFRRALALSPTLESASLGLGHVAYARGRYRDAIAEYGRQIARFGPDDRCASEHRSIATISLRLGDLNRAERAAAEALRCDPTAYWAALLVARQRGERDTVDRLAQSVDVVPPPDRGMRPFERFRAYERGMLALSNGRPTEGVAHFAKALRHRPAFFNIDSLEDCLANAYLELGRLDEAIAEYQRVLRINSNDALSRYHLGLAYERKGMRTEARAEHARFLEIWKDADPDIPELRDAKTRLRP